MSPTHETAHFVARASITTASGGVGSGGGGMNGSYALSFGSSGAGDGIEAAVNGCISQHQAGVESMDINETTESCGVGNGGAAADAGAAVAGSGDPRTRRNVHFCQNGPADESLQVRITNVVRPINTSEDACAAMDTTTSGGELGGEQQPASIIEDGPAVVGGGSIGGGGGHHDDYDAYTEERAPTTRPPRNNGFFPSDLPSAQAMQDQTDYYFAKV